jgi:urea transport system permease protein
VTAAIGAALEWGVVRHLCKRPLMTLRATWAVSLFLCNLVRVVFGTQTLQFETPFSARGGVQVPGDVIVTWNRVGAILMAAATLALVWLLLRRTPFGLNLRAVTQNRAMADCIGIDTRRVDILAFALGSGLAALAGLVLSQRYSVNPLMGTNFTIDSFMVVALGGVASPPGTVVAALVIGL